MQPYPGTAQARDRFVLDRRPSRQTHDPFQSHGVLVDEEPSTDGTTVHVVTIFLTGRECPWRCVMCDLWRYTIATDTPKGALPTQIAAARQLLTEQYPRTAIRQLKLYNAGSFFDPRAVPDEDVEAIARGLEGLPGVIVESHPSLVGERTRRFLDALHRVRPAPTLEVAMGLETGHPEALERLNKHMTKDGFLAAAGRLASLGAGLRVFLLVSPPFVAKDEQDEWLVRSLDLAVRAGASVVSLIPTRPGNGALEALAEMGSFQPPRLHDLERSHALALDHAPQSTRVLADLWDLDRFADCLSCRDARRRRLLAANLEQRPQPPVPCTSCGGTAAIASARHRSA